MNIITYGEYINGMLNTLADYINHLVRYDKKLREIMLKMASISKTKDIKIYEDLIQYLKGVRKAHQEATELFDELDQIGKWYSDGEEISYYVQIFNEKFMNTELPLYLKMPCDLIGAALEADKKMAEGMPTGGAAEVVDIVEDIRVPLEEENENNEKVILTEEQKVIKDYTSDNSSKQSIFDDSPTIAGQKRGEPMTFEQAGGSRTYSTKIETIYFGSNTNPYYSFGEGYHRNCQVCIAVFEARMRGYNIIALPLDEKNKVMMKLRRKPELAFIDPQTKKAPKKLTNKEVFNYNDLNKWLNEIINPNERYAYIFKFKPTGSTKLVDHIIIVYKTEKGDLVYYDPQNGRILSAIQLIELIAFESYVNENDKLKAHPPIVFRIDNADLNIKYLNKISIPASYK